MKEDIVSTASGVSFFVFPVLLLGGFLMHPDILSFEVTDTAEALMKNFRGQAPFHIGHLLVFLSVPFIIVCQTSLMSMATRGNRRLAGIGWLVGVTGAAILAADKGALCIVLSAFDTLAEGDMAGLKPALTTIVERRGLLSLFYLLPLLPIGSALQLLALIREKSISPSSGAPGILGLLLLNNPDIEIISSAGAVLMCFAYFPLGLRTLKHGTPHAPAQTGRTP